MKLLFFILGMIIGGTIAIILHCLIIVGKQADKSLEK